MHLPVNMEEAGLRGWQELDIVLVTGDAYIDHPAFGVPLLARFLEKKGFRVGIIAQPDWKNPDSFKVLGKPRLFFGVTSGAMDSMVAHYTPEKRIRRDDAYTPGNRHGSRPNRAVIVYTSCCKAAYRDVPVVIGGIEASLRRFAHYDYWDDKVRRSILLDSKADLLVYGMGEMSIFEVSERLSSGDPISGIRDVRGTAYVSRPTDVGSFYHEVASFEIVSTDKKQYAAAFKEIEINQNSLSAKPLSQKHADRFICCNPPSFPLSGNELDDLYSLPFTRLPHPSYKEEIPAWQQIKSSVTTHRGCYGGCAFCAITCHQGKSVASRSIRSIVEEVERIASSDWFNGSISDLGGPTANMFATKCGAPDAGKGCKRLSCLYPDICRNLLTDDSGAAEMLIKVRKIKKVKHVAVSSGIRYDLLKMQPSYFKELVAHHVGGLMKVAPEHCSGSVLRIMRKPSFKIFSEFLAFFREVSSAVGKRQSVIPYLMSGHPGTKLTDMVDLALLLRENGLYVEQVQEFTPTPGTLATCIYYTGLDPYSLGVVYSAKSDKEKRMQKSLLLSHLPEQFKNSMEALKAAGRGEVANILCVGSGLKHDISNTGAKRLGAIKKNVKSIKKS